MTTLLDNLTTIESRSLDALKDVQEAVVGATRTVVETVAPYTPNVGSVPFASELPAPAAIIENVFDFAGQVLAANRAFAEGLVNAFAPLGGKVDAQPKEEKAPSGPRSTKKSAA